MVKYKRVYNDDWPAHLNDVEIEMTCIRDLKGHWKNSQGEPAGIGLFGHYKALYTALWPEMDHTRWSDLCLSEMIQNQVTVLMSPKSCGKTHEAAKFCLTEYFLNPTSTTVLFSSTDARGLELRVWGEIKKLWEMAHDRWDFLPGHIIDSKYALSTKNLEDDKVRDMRNGMIGIPCIVNHRYVGIGKYVGCKNLHVRLLADEAQFMHATFLDAISNLDANPDFKAIICGNPLDPLDSLGKAAEPKVGWEAVGEPDKTTVWETRFMNGRCVNLVGTDSPNFDYPQDQPPKFPYLINKRSIDSTVAFYTKDSLQYYSQCKGVMKSGLTAHRVITREMCRQFGATLPAEWRGGPRIRVYGLDAAYGTIGGDRCVGGFIEFGEDVDGKTLISVNPPMIIPVSVKEQRIPEDQIALWVKQDCEKWGIPPENVFYDATGRGSLGTAFARHWSALVNPIEFGGVPSDRPVCDSLYIYDNKTHNRRLKRCDEHYSKRVTEFWYTWRYTIESGQMRGLPQDVMDEGCMREWKMVRGDKIEIETKTEMKERMGRSPDLADWLCICLEGTRRLGFEISRMGSVEAYQGNYEWLDKIAEKQKDLRKRHELTYA